MKFKTRQRLTEMWESELQLFFSGNLGKEINLKVTREVELIQVVVTQAYTHVTGTYYSM